ncbi:uncharacterized protein MONOS_14655 [Monocercomonoides exilis]|uniref:uncharacterized protein n=1 Tax=Monocercomonoides exilis TaxID=2049356 RepID=UPI00355987CE|nr:hypothetical protein MONOS_14655 [Monocercomonoides exilis]|eukprot:MONOS_14655.1-p1 / transcript=MONOS_14655.1 / gene=MONOS_14655 / organism=Monocercomonoides_exilis_PA203 / gene_product=unspecified product / transcript_product=unspecified product / location=Mono_scaffold01042:18529-18756(+) / protein_length=76 / sequence_SO=supercontig / SO=protein_coding / is_pseudo=false
MCLTTQLVIGKASLEWFAQGYGINLWRKLEGLEKWWKSTRQFGGGENMREEEKRIHCGYSAQWKEKKVEAQGGIS